MTKRKPKPEPRKGVRLLSATERNLLDLYAKDLYVLMVESNESPPILEEDVVLWRDGDLVLSSAGTHYVRSVYEPDGIEKRYKIVTKLTYRRLREAYVRAMEVIRHRSQLKIHQLVIEKTNALPNR